MSADTNGTNQQNPANANPAAEPTAADAQPSEATASHGPGSTESPETSGEAGQKPEAAKAYVDPSIAAEARIAELEAQVAEMRDRYVRAYAETENLRKRSEREKSDVSKYAVTNFARDMVAIADNLKRAVEAAGGSETEQSPQMKALLDGVVLTDQELQKALEKHGVRSIAAKGEIFDPHKHQAVMEQDDPSVAAGTILQVFQDGYEIGDRVLRPSMVVVSKGGAKPVKSPEPQPANEAPAAANDDKADPSGADSAGQTGSDASSDETKV